MRGPEAGPRARAGLRPGGTSPTGGTAEAGRGSDASAPARQSAAQSGEGGQGEGACAGGVTGACAPGW